MKANRSFTTISPLLFGFVLMTSITGCVIPLPRTDSGFTRTNVNEQAVRQFTQEQITEEDVILKLGEPDTVSAGERELAYHSEIRSAFWFVPVPVAIGGPIYDHRYFIFVFNSPEHIQGIIQTNEPPNITPRWQDAVLKSLASGDGSNSTNAVMNWSAYWLPEVEGFRDRIAEPNTTTLGRLLLTESNLVFVSESDFAEARPALNLPFTSISQVYLDRFLLSRRLVVHTDTGQVHSFRIWGWSAGEDQSAMKAASKFIESKIESRKPEK